MRAALRYERTTPRRIEFVLEVNNGSSMSMLATIYAVVGDGQEVPLPPFSFWIESHTEARIVLPLPWLAAFSTRALAVRLQGPAVHQRLETAMPRPWPFLWFFGGALAVGLGVALALAIHPRANLASVPDRIVGGSPLSFHYIIDGVGNRRWEIDDLSGARIASGTLDAAEGNATIAAPRPQVQTVYELHVGAAGPFGSADASRPLVVVTPHPSAAAPRIISFTLDRSIVPDAGTVVARYRVSADSGDLLAVDAQGTIWAQAAIHGDGITRLALPRFGGDKELQIRLVVRRGAQLAAAGIGVEAIGR